MDTISAADTILSSVDGQRGRLIIRGHDVEEMAGRTTFEEAVTLLWSDLVDPPRDSLGASRCAAFERLVPLLGALDGDSARAVRVALAATADDDAATVAAVIPVAIAVAWRQRQGLPLIAPDPACSHAADLLRMIGSPAALPFEARVAALDAYLVTVCEHGMNASTFTARVVASTAAGLAGCVTAAYCALQGPLHGGAPGPVLDMLDEIGSRETDDEIDAWLDARLRSGARLMGFGHKIYRVRDPRADVLKTALLRLRQSGDSQRLARAEHVEARALQTLARHKPDRPLHTNVEFYTALLLEGVGLPRELFTPVFAVGRVAGWIAHVFEQRRSGRLIRPQSTYVGPMPDQSLIK